ncbi:MAG: class II glutamine amidotransferase [Candidatus Nanopelagicaceae bacterium]|nr:class II glutamine amidotransferase [Candidatus Nanopelagicaceae bacterium]
MCRLLGYSSASATTFGEVVGSNFKEFVKLADDHCDGWGIAVSGEEGANSYKEPVAATKSGSFNAKLDSHKSKAALLHLRWATAGMAINENNTHPFTYQDISFIHNGSITPADCLDPLIDKKLLTLAKGTTDSEKYFLYLLTQIQKHGFIEGIKTGLSYIKNNCSFSSINMMITNKDYFVAACVYNQDKVPDRFKEQTDYYHLKYTKQNGQVVVASSGWDQDGWEEIPNARMLVVDRVGKKQI